MENKGNQESIFERETDVIRHSRKVLDKSDDIVHLEEYKALLDNYEQLLEEMRLITSISDKIQGKLKIANEQLKIQAEQINKMNWILDAENSKLQVNIKELARSKVMLHEIDFIEFSKSYPDKASCYKFLSDLKWTNGYKCRKCGHAKYCQGPALYSRRCTKCTYNESVTAFTLFHKCKFDIIKAFYMVFLVVANKGNISSYELSDKLLLEQKTCWKFKQKILVAMKDKQKHNVDKKGGGWEYLILETE
ncbi:MAG TPA: IS1595 family transposase [Cytophagaceae bacterium]|nr:IS1595 family transposase [Cytophagaceae bacterium]